ncbi:MAG: ATP-binding protein [Candidatus Phytoplasma pruni]|uniref:ATP-binding protein n=1 Tax=Milkweed yellows phytoplasma TaxID=208434 RepID=UPI000375A63F|nr:ATP-binding protein [Milkweed yellows phytoplasma]
MVLLNKKYLDEMKEVISNDPETKNLKVEDKDVIMVFNYLQNKHKDHRFGYKQVLKTKPYLHIMLQETTATKHIDLKNNLEQNNILFNQDLKLEEVDLNAFQINNLVQEKILQKTKEIIRSFDRVKTGFYLHGHFGTGKTFLLKALTKELIHKNISVLFIFMPDLARQFKTTWYSDLLEKKIYYLKKVPCLILDDIGSENMTYYFRDDVLLPLLYYRFEHKLPTFFSSNFDLEDLFNYFKSFQDFNSEIKAYKIVNLIKKNTSIYNFSALNKEI